MSRLGPGSDLVARSPAGDTVVVDDDECAVDERRCNGLKSKEEARFEESFEKFPANKTRSGGAAIPCTESRHDNDYLVCSPR